MFRDEVNYNRDVDKTVQKLLQVINPKVNVLACPDFEFSYKDVAIQYTPPLNMLLYLS